MKTNAIVAGTWIVGLFLAGAACERGSRLRSRGQPPPAKESPPAAGASGPRGASPQPGGKRLRIALIAKSASNPAFLSTRTGAEDRARELSTKLGVSIETAWMTPPEESARLQVQRITQAVNERFDAILISGSNDTTVAGAIDDAVSRGVAVMTFDSDVPRSRRFSFCGVDDEQLGRAVMLELVRVLPRKAKIALLAGNRDAPNLRRRVDGFLREAALHRRLKIVGTFGHAETPNDATVALLRVAASYPQVTGWAIMGGWPLYTRTLLSELQPGPGLGRHRIVAVNALPQQLIYVEKGLAPVLLAQPTYLWGAVGVETIVDKLVLHKTVREWIPLEVVRITSQNLGSWARQLQAWGFLDVPEEYLHVE